MKRYRAGACTALLLCDLGLAPGLRAQNATWNGVTSNFNAAANWLPNSVPTGTAFFGAAGLPGITFSAPATLGGFTFNAGAQAFTFGTTSQTAGLVLSGAGIVNNSANAPAFTVGNGGVVAATPGLSFTNAASAGNVVITNTDGGVTGFLGSSTAASAVMINTGGTAFFSGAVFVGSSTAANALIINNKGGITTFNQSASAGNATFANSGGSLASFSITRLIDALTNPSGTTPMPSEVGITAFLGGATAGNATITNNSGGLTAFLGTSTAGSATIVTNAGGATFFTGSSSGGTATLLVNPGGTLDLSAHALGSMAAGSLSLATGSTYRIGVTAAGQSNALGLSGPATLQGGTLLLARRRATTRAAPATRSSQQPAASAGHWPAPIPSRSSSLRWAMTPTASLSACRKALPAAHRPRTSGRSAARSINRQPPQAATSIRRSGRSRSSIHRRVPPP